MRRHLSPVLAASAILALAGGPPAAAAEVATHDPLYAEYSRALASEARCVRTKVGPHVHVSDPRASRVDPTQLVYFVTVDAPTAAEARRVEAIAEAARVACVSTSGSAAASDSWFATASAAGAPSDGVTPYGGSFMTRSHDAGYTMLWIGGSGLVPGAVMVSHAHGEGFGTICNYKAKIWGTRQNGSAYSQTSSLLQKCTPVRVGIDMNPVNIAMKNGSGFYGQFYEDGAWAPGIPMATIQG